MRKFGGCQHKYHQCIYVLPQASSKVVVSGLSSPRPIATHISSMALNLAALTPWNSSTLEPLMYACAQGACAAQGRPLHTYLLHDVLTV
jgi:hypothetical protein